MNEVDIPERFDTLYMEEDNGSENISDNRSENISDNISEKVEKKTKISTYTSSHYIDDVEFPYNETKQKAIHAYFKNMTQPKKHMRYTFSENGDLETYDVKKGEVIDTIQLNYYRPITKEEFETQNNERIAALIATEEQIDIQKSLLRKAYEIYKETGNAANVVEINQDIINLERQKTAIRSPVRSSTWFEKVQKRSIYFDMPFETRMVEDIDQYYYRDFPLWKLYGKYTDSKDIHEATKQKSLIVGEVYLKNGSIARIFNNVEDENAFLSIFNVKDFVYKNTQYSSPYQAFEVLRLKENGFEEVAKKIMDTRAIKQMQIRAKSFSQPLKNMKAVWKDILREFYKQNGEFMQKLIKTNDDVLVFGNTTPYLGGIGLAGQEEIIDVGKWIYPNVVGEVLMELRGELREVDETKSEAFTASAVTAEQLANRKKGVIISAMKK